MLYILLVMGDSFGTGGCICGILICKVMKPNAPDNMYIPQKIYLPYKDGKVVGLVKETGVPYKSGVDGNIEYTRTDAFIEKACEWIREFNNHHYIMRYSDSCEPPLSELTEWFKNYMKGE